MDTYDIKRYALILAKLAELEGMKAENSIRYGVNKSPAYDEKSFMDISMDLEKLAYCHNEQL